MTVVTTPAGGLALEGVPLLQMTGITKRFPGVVANDRVDFDVRTGEIHTLFGENGAGKSTLMRVLYGLYRPDEGEIKINGEQVAITSPANAIRHGIGMIHQHFMLVNTLTVAENVALGEKSRARSVDRPRPRVGEDPRTRRHLRAQRRPTGHHLAAVSRRASTSGDHQGALPQCLVAGPRRTDGRADAARGGRAFRRPAAYGPRSGAASCSSRTRSTRCSISPTASPSCGPAATSATLESAEATRGRLVELMVGHSVALETPPPQGVAGDVRLSVKDLRVQGRPGDRSRPRALARGLL